MTNRRTLQLKHVIITLHDPKISSEALTVLVRRVGEGTVDKQMHDSPSALLSPGFDLFLTGMLC